MTAIAYYKRLSSIRAAALLFWNITSLGLAIIA